MQMVMTSYETQILIFRVAIVTLPREAFYVVSALHHCLLVFLFLADQIFYISYVDRQHFCLRSFASFQLFSIFGAVGLFRSDMLLIFNMIWP